MDTNIVIEAVRTKCWNALRGYFRLETTEKCLEEARTGSGRRPGYVHVSDDQLTKLTVHPVSNKELISLSFRYEHADRIDPGERHLWAHALGRNDDAWMLACADKGALLIAMALGWKDRICSLEKLAADAGARPDLKDHFTEKRLVQWRTEFIMGGSQ